MLEGIQRRATKLIPELRDLSCEERLKECEIRGKEVKRRSNKSFFLILNGYENIDGNM